MNENRTRDEQLAEFGTKRYKKNLVGIANRLRELADRIEREGQVNERDTGNDDWHVCRAATVAHSLSWGFANLNIETLLSSASDADGDRRRRDREGGAL